MRVRVRVRVRVVVRVRLRVGMSGKVAGKGKDACERAKTALDPNAGGGVHKDDYAEAQIGWVRVKVSVRIRVRVRVSVSVKVSVRARVTSPVCCI